MADIKQIQNGEKLTFGDQISLTAKLALPAIVAQLSSILMQYIDASMVGQLGADDAAAIGLVSTSLWLFWGICSAMTMGFSVQVAHKVGAKDFEGARRVLRQGVTASLVFSAIVALIGICVAFPLPHWLGGVDAICSKSTSYFLIFVAALPFLTINFLASGMLRCVGDMKTPGMLYVLMAIMDVVFNFVLIFPTHHISLWGMNLVIPGADLGVIGAALGTVIAEIITALLMNYFLMFRQPDLRIVGERGSYRPDATILRKALKISAPMTMEHAVICGAQIAVTVIVAPLGVVAIAANAFAITAESLCYMPGYGIGDAATTLVGQSHGAGRRNLVKRFGYITVGLGVVVMSVMGVVMWLAAPFMMNLMTPVEEIRTLGTEILRIEAWAEPMFAASIVAYGVFVGVGDTMLPAFMNFGSIWLVRLPLAALLAPSFGLKGVWMAMCAELCFRGLIFLARLVSGKWNKLRKNDIAKDEAIIDSNWENLN